MVKVGFLVVLHIREASGHHTLSSSSSRTERLGMGSFVEGGLEEGVKEGVEKGVRETWERD